MPVVHLYRRAHVEHQWRVPDTRWSFRHKSDLIIAASSPENCGQQKAEPWKPRLRFLLPEAIPLLILGNARVYLLAPGGDAALDVIDVLEARILQEPDGPGTARAGPAVYCERLVLVELREALG